MKRSFYLLLTLFLFSSASFAGDLTRPLKGIETPVPELMQNRFAIGMSTVNPYHRDWVALGDWGFGLNLMGAYEHRFTPLLSAQMSMYIGLVFVQDQPYEFSSRDITVAQHNLLIGPRIHWANWKSGTAYSGAGIGYLSASVTYHYHNESKTLRQKEFAYQIDFVGVQLYVGRSKRFGFWGEVGYGMQGYSKLGINFRF